MEAVRKTCRVLGRLCEREAAYYRLRPRIMLAFLTYRCTSSCRSCAMWKRSVEKEELTLREWERIVFMAAQCGIRHIEMFGGDALLRKDVLFPLTRWAKAQGIPSVDLVTNAFLLDEAAAGQVARAGFDTVYVSLDGCGDVHERIRGVPGAFDRVRAGLENLITARGKDRSPKIIANCTVSSLNLRALEEIIPFAARMGVDEVFFEYIGEFPESSIAASLVEGVAPQPYFTPRGGSLLLNAEDAAYLKRLLPRLRESGRRLGISVLTKNIDALSASEMTSGEVPNRRCYVCRSQVTVDPYGELLPCPFFNTYSLGNLRVKHIRSMWRHERHRKFVKLVDEKRIGLCRRCILGVERNPTFWRQLRQTVRRVAEKVRGV